MIIELLFVLTAIIVGARLGGIGLGVSGGLGLAILVFGFGLKPTSPPVDVILMITAVIAAASCMQAAGGLDLMVRWAEKLLRKNPSHITLVSPLVTYFFTFFAGTGHVAYSILPVIAEVATETHIRPERPLSIAVIASQQAITASPISAATVALLSMLTIQCPSISLFQIMIVAVPSTLFGVLAGALYSMHVGKTLDKDPEYLRRCANGEFKTNSEHQTAKFNTHKAILSLVIFLTTTVAIVLFGSVESFRPLFDGKPLQMSSVIEILMLSAAAIILLITHTDGIQATQGSVFSAGMQAVVAIFGIAWMGDTFISGNMLTIRNSIEQTVTQMPWLFGIALFLMSILLFSQAATIRALLPLGIALGIPPQILVALFPAVNGYFVIPNYPTIVAAINFDRTGTTHIGKYVINHSFLIPGLIATSVAIITGLIISSRFF